MSRRFLAVLCALGLAGAAAAPPAEAAEAPTRTPGELVVALSMPSSGFQVGAIRGRDVVLARGFEIDLARAIAKRLGIGKVRFVNEALFSTLVSAGAKDWDVALAQITVTAERAKRVDFSKPYLAADEGVLMRSGIAGEQRSLADLRGLVLCAERATTGGSLVVQRVRPTRKPRLLENLSKLLYELAAGRCDAAVADAPMLAVAAAEAPERYGRLAGRIATGERYAIALPRGSVLRAAVDSALGKVTADGTVALLQRKWLKATSSTLPELR